MIPCPCAFDPDGDQQDKSLRARQRQSGGRLKSDWHRPMPVRVQVNGKARYPRWRINLMPVGDGDFFLYLLGRFARPRHERR